MKESIPSSVQPAHAAQKPRHWFLVRRARGETLAGECDIFIGWAPRARGSSYDPTTGLVSVPSCSTVMLTESPGFKNTGGLRKTDRKSTRLNSSHGYISYAVF